MEVHTDAFGRKETKSLLHLVSLGCSASMSSLCDVCGWKARGVAVAGGLIWLTRPGNFSYLFNVTAEPVVVTIQPFKTRTCVHLWNQQRVECSWKWPLLQSPLIWLMEMSFIHYLVSQHVFFHHRRKLQ